MNGAVLEFLSGVRSIRRFSDEPVPAEWVARAVSVAQRAPSTSNLQPYHVIDVQDRGVRQRLYDAMVTQKFVLDAPVVLVTCIDWSKMAWLTAHAGADRLPAREVKQLLGAVETSVFTHHLTLALMGLGLGVCWIASPYTNLEDVANILEVPTENVMPLHMVIAGFPAEQPPLRPRLPLEAVLSQDRYRPAASEHLAAFFSSADAALRAEDYFAKYDTGVGNLAEHYRLKFGTTGHSRTWEKLLSGLKRFS